MKNRILAALLMAMPAIACLSQNVKVNIKISDTDTVLLLVRGMAKCDTLYTNTGSFRYTRELQHPELLTFVFVKGKQSIEAIKKGNERGMRSVSDGMSKEIFAEKGIIELQCRFADISRSQWVMSSHIAQDTYKTFRKRFDPLVRMARVIIDSSYTAANDPQTKKTYNMLFEKIIGIEEQVAEAFAAENSGNATGAYVLYRYCRVNDYRVLDSIYRLFSPQLMETAYLKNVKIKLNALAEIKVGNLAPEFSVISDKAIPVRLSSFRGKYVVLDFWGSWCGPCIKGIPKMKAYYSRYADKVSFIGIACNDTDTSWRAAITQYQLNWPQICNGTGAGDIAARYNIEAYPTKILLDKEGRVIGSFAGENEAFYQKLDTLLQ